MPLPIGLLAAAGLSGGVGAAQAISGAKKSEYEKQNEARLRRLQGLEERGQLGGLSGRETAAFGSELGRLQQAAGASRTRSEALQAATGGTSGADLARLRQEQAGQEAAAGQQVAQAQRIREMEKERAGRTEIAQREAAAEEARLARRQSVFSGLSQAAGGVGQAVAFGESMARAKRAAGAPVDPATLSRRLDELGVSESAKRSILAADPNTLSADALAVFEGRVETPAQQAIYAALLEDSLGGGAPQVSPYNLSAGMGWTP